MNKYSFIYFCRVRQKDDKKTEQIFQATLELVVQKGLAGITMCDICKTAGIATGTLYIYFKNKEELISAIFHECRTESAAFYFRDLDENEPFESSFRKVFFNILNYRRQHFQEYIFLEQCYHSPFISQETRKKSLKALAPLYQLLDKGRKEKKVKDLDHSLLTGYFIGAINEVIKRAQYGTVTLNDCVLERLYEMCRDGLRS